MAESRAGAAFRELLAQNEAAAHASSKKNKMQQQQQAPPTPVPVTTAAAKPQTSLLGSQLLVLGDGASTAGARRAALAAFRAWLEQQEHQQQDEACLGLKSGFRSVDAHLSDIHILLYLTFFQYRRPVETASAGACSKKASRPSSSAWGTPRRAAGSWHCTSSTPSFA